MGPAGRSEFELSVHCACFFFAKKKESRRRGRRFGFWSAKVNAVAAHAPSSPRVPSPPSRRSNRRYCTTRAKPRPQRSHTRSLASLLLNSCSMSPTASETPVQRASAAAPESGEDAGQPATCLAIQSAVGTHSLLQRLPVLLLMVSVSCLVANCSANLCS